MKVLITASTAIHLKSFHLPYLKWFQENGYIVHVAFNGNEVIDFTDKQWNISFGRSPFDIENMRAFLDLSKVINKNDYKIIHCHTPMASVITRLAAKSIRKKGVKVIYTAHGFHFFKGAPIKNWLVFYPIEKWLSRYTDAIITINSEDYHLLFDRKFYSKGKYQINGIGIDPNRLLFNKEDLFDLKQHLGIKPNDITIIYIAEFIHRKNHKFILESIPQLIKKFSNIKFLFAGGGVLMDSIERLAKEKNIQDYIVFLGFIKTIGKYIDISDIGISSSRQEGLGLGVAELMFREKPVVISEDRGHNELVKHGFNGYVFQQNNQEQFIEFLSLLINDEKERMRIGKNAHKSMLEFTIDHSLKKMIEIYKAYLD